MNSLEFAMLVGYPYVFNLPTHKIMTQELEVSQEVFKDFYLRKYSGRRLVWHPSLGTCVLRAQFPKYVLNCFS